MDKHDIIMMIYSMLYDCDEKMLEDLYVKVFEELYKHGKYNYV